MKFLRLIIPIVLFSLTALGKAKIQNEDIKSASDLLAAGGTISSLINDDKIYVKANGLNIRLFEAIESGVLSADLPAGSVLTFAGQICPPGYLDGDGASYARSLYPNLFAAIGTAHGFNSPTTFNVPNYRGRFLRGVDPSASVDPDALLRTAAATGGSTGASVGSVQGHAFQTHNHLQNPHAHPQTGRTANAQIGGNFGSGPTQVLIAPIIVDTALQTATNIAASASGVLAQPTSFETRPVNSYVKYCIKF